MLKKHADSQKLYGAICASPALVLEPHGLLKVCVCVQQCALNLYMA